ncbi:hypothetical protein L1987_22308 [Smallanthus sonchifolius]|uniref:Uncharacterized protein n=1 Tax=Smallanthus sonchifolius TaxID=185202 RepID=A0ACB9IFU8_9ASTR|nr:hypothetical protein L1987_22308 [Smallanthus sonchifolius]
MKYSHTRGAFDQNFFLRDRLRRIFCYEIVICSSESSTIRTLHGRDGRESFILPGCLQTKNGINRLTIRVNSGRGITSRVLESEKGNGHSKSDGLPDLLQISSFDLDSSTSSTRSEYLDISSNHQEEEFTFEKVNDKELIVWVYHLLLLL